MVTYINIKSQSFMLGNYHEIAKNYLRFVVAEFEWRFNRRRCGEGVLEAVMCAIFSVSVMTNDDLVALFIA